MAAPTSRKPAEKAAAEPVLLSGGNPFYGVEDRAWFLSFHCFARYVKVTFFRGSSLRPVPPVELKYEHVRYLHIFEDGRFDEAQFADWVKQASQLSGERM